MERIKRRRAGSGVQIQVIIPACLAAILHVLPLDTSTAWARHFNAPVKLKIYLRDSANEPARVIGFTPAKNRLGVWIPVGKMWYVRPVDRLTEADWTRLVDLINEESIPGLDLSNRWDLTNADLAKLEKARSLETLFLSRTRITDAGLAPLQQLSNLRRLDLSHSKVTSKGLANLNHWPELNMLDISGTAVTPDGLAPLKGLEKLTTLVLGPRMTDPAAESLKRLAPMEELDLSETQITDQGLWFLKHLKHLKTLYLNKRVTNAGLAHLASVKKLERLDLSGAKITDVGLATLEGLPHLEELALSETPVGDAGLRFIGKLKRLRALELSQTRVTSAGLIHLAGLRHLEMLSLSWTQLTEEDLKSLAPLGNLRVVVLHGSPLSESLVTHLRSMATLQRTGRPEKLAKKESDLAGLAKNSPNPQEERLRSAGAQAAREPELSLKSKKDVRFHAKAPSSLSAELNPVREQTELLPLLPSEGWEKVGMRAHRRGTPPSPPPSPAHDAGEGVGDVVLRLRSSQKSRSSEVSGLKRLHQVFVDDFVSDVIPATPNPIIESSYETPLRGLGEIHVNVRPTAE